MITPHYFKTAFRHLLKYKVQSAISICGLALGLTCFSLCLYYSRFILNTDQDFPTYPRLAQVCNNTDSTCSFYSHATDKEQLDALHLSGIRNVTRVYVGPSSETVRQYTIPLPSGIESPFALSTLEADPNFIETFGCKLLQGAPQRMASVPNAVILTQSAAKKIFGLQDAVGRQMYLNSHLSTSSQGYFDKEGVVYTIEGVIEDFPLNNSVYPMQSIDAFVCNDSQGLFANKKYWAHAACQTYVLLEHPRHKKEINLNLSDNRSGSSAYLQLGSLGQTYELKNFRILAYITAGIGLLILLSALLNFFNFITHTFYQRIREYSIRKYTGADGKDLAAMLATQLSVMLGIAFLIMLGIIQLSLPYLHFKLSRTLFVPLEWPVILQHMLQYMVLIATVCLSLCVLVSLRLNRMAICPGITGNQTHTPDRHFFRNTLIGFQLFICFLFIPASLALYMQSENAGKTFYPSLDKKEKKQILQVTLDYTAIHSQRSVILSKLGQIPSIETIAITEGKLHANQFSMVIINEDKSETVLSPCADKEVLDMFHIKLLRGRLPSHPQEILVDTLTERSHPVGSKITIFPDYNYEICGVFDNLYFGSLDGIGEVGKILRPNNNNSYCYIRSAPGKEKEVRQQTTALLKEHLPPTLTPQILSIQELSDEQEFSINQLKSYILTLTWISLFITLCGVYSTIVLDTARRQKEVAIRKINGATLSRILLLFIRLYLILLTIAAAAGFLVAQIGIRAWVIDTGIEFYHGIFFWTAIFGAVLLIVVGTIFLKIWHTAQLNPAQLIKHE